MARFLFEEAWETIRNHGNHETLWESLPTLKDCETFLRGIGCLESVLALGAIRKKPAVIETAEGDVIAIRQMMFLSHSYDHRVVDGQLGGSFVRRVADHLEAFDPHQPVV